MKVEEKSAVYAAMTQPKSWQRATLGELLPIKYGKSLPGKLRDICGSRPVFGSSGQVGTHTSALTTGPTLIIGRKGNVGAIHYSSEPCWPIDTVYYVEPGRGQNLRYYKYLLDSLNLVKLDKSTAVPGLSRDDYNAVEVVVAPPELQENIVAEIEKQFSRLDEAVANLKRVKANLKRYKAAVLKAAVEGKLTEAWRKQHPDTEPASELLQRILTERRAKWEQAELAKMQAKGKTPKDDAWKKKYPEPAAPDTTGLPVLPGGWVWASVEQLTWLVTSGSRGWGDFYSDTGVLFIRAQDIKTDVLNIRGIAWVNIPADAEGTRSSVSYQDILVTITGANVTKSALVPPLEEVAFVSQHVALLKLNLPEIAPFVFSWIVSPSNGRKILEAWAYGAGKPGLSLEQIRSLPVALPPHPEQRQINAEVDRHLSHADEAEAQVNANFQRAERLRQSILTGAFSSGLHKSKAMSSVAAISII